MSVRQPHPVSSGGDTSGLVPYTGATGSVDLGANSLTATNVTATNAMILDSASDAIISVDRGSNGFNREAAIDFTTAGVSKFRFGLTASRSGSDAYVSLTDASSNELLYIQDMGATANLVVTGTVTGSNLSGTNTGDQDLSTLAPKANPTFSGAVTLSENCSIALDPAGSADGKYSGITVAGTAGTTLAFGDLVYLAVADSRWELADADAASTSGDVMLGMCVLAAAADGDPTTLLLHGIIRADAAFPALTIGAPVYVGTTAGDIQVAQPSGVDDVIRRVGFAMTADEIYFNPSNDYVTHT